MVPATRTLEPATKLVPVTVTASGPAEPASAVEGDNTRAPGTGFATVSVAAGEEPPLGPGFVTTTGRVPAVATSAAVSTKTTVWLLTTVAARTIPATETEEAVAKLLPVTVMLTGLEAPTSTVAGERLIAPGWALFTTSTAGADTPPPGLGFVTTTLNVPAAAVSAAVTGKVRLLAPETEAARGTPLTETVADAAKLDPAMAMVVGDAEPATRDDGVIVPMTGTRPVTARLTAADDPPPGAGFVTTTGRVATLATSALPTEKLSFALLINVAARETPLTDTVAPGAKPAPPSVTMVADGVPTAMVDGDSAPAEGTVFVMVSEAAADDPPPGAGLVTTTGTAPAIACSAVLTGKVRDVADRTVAARGVPATETVAPAAKLPPVRVTVVGAAVPKAMVEGKTVAMEGVGLFTGRGRAAEMPPPGAGFCTATCSVVPTEVSAAVVVKDSCEPLETVVVRAAPFTRTVLPGRKPDPCRVTTAPDAPTDRAAGSSDEMAGAGFVIRKLDGEELPPPGAGFITVMGNEPAVAASAAVRVTDTSVGLV